MRNAHRNISIRDLCRVCRSFDNVYHKMYPASLFDGNRVPDITIVKRMLHLKASRKENETTIKTQHHPQWVIKSIYLLHFGIESFFLGQAIAFNLFIFVRYLIS